MAKKEKVKESGIEQVLIDRFGDKRLKEWKEEYHPRKLTVIEVEGKMAVLKPVTASTVSNYTQLYVREGADKAGRFFFEDLWLDGDREIVDEEEYFISAMQEIDFIVDLKKSTFYRV